MPVDSPMPPVRLIYLLEMWAECGTGSDWQGLQAWAEMTGTPVCQWEATALREMAGQYRSALVEYNGTNALPPFMPKQPATASGSILARARRG